MNPNQSTYTTKPIIIPQIESNKMNSTTISSSKSQSSKSNITTNNSVSLSHKIVYSGISGAIATTCIYPIDITKTKLMNSKTNQYSGPLNCAYQIYRSGGLRGFYAGWPPNVIFVMPEKAIKLTMNDVFRSQLTTADGRLPLQREMLAGGLAGFCQVIATNPMELLKIQGATSDRRATRINYFVLMRRLGLTGLYTGVVSTLARDVPFSMVYFTIYSQSKLWLLGSDQTQPVGFKAFLAGAIAGTTAAAITCPIDVIKTRVHAAAEPTNLSFGKFIKKEFGMLGEGYCSIMRNEGAGALLKGIVPRCLIISPLFAITMACYEKMQSTFR